MRKIGRLRGLSLVLLACAALALQGCAQGAAGPGAAPGTGGDVAYSPAYWQTLNRAELGEAAAQYRIGLMHYLGEGAPRDFEKSIAWFRRAAAQEHPAAEFGLGELFRKGKGVRADPGEAVRWYRRAARRGHDEAQNNLGLMYVTGSGVGRDMILGYMWLAIAAAQGNPKAERNRRRTKARMNETELREAERFKQEWLTRATQKVS